MAPALEAPAGNGSKTQEQAITKAAAPNVAMTRNGFAPTNMEEAWRFASALARSGFVPERYRGKPDECLIALDLSSRLQTHWLAVMQHCYQVHGQPGLDANLTIGLVNQSGRFEPIQYEVEGSDPKDPKYRVRAFSRRIGNPAILYGPWIDWPLVKGEGWLSKSQSKWQTMPEQMFHYRAGSWWQKRHCPEITLGMPTTDELYDAGPRAVDSAIIEPENVGGVQGLKSRMMQQGKPAENEAGAGEGEAAQDQMKPAAEPSPTSTHEVPKPDSTTPTPEPVSTGAEGKQNTDPTPGTAPAGNPTTKAAVEKPKTNGKTMYHCKDDDCESKGTPFDNPTKIRSGKKAGTLICPHCAGENIEVVSEDQQDVDPNAFDNAPTAADVQAATGGVLTCPAGHVVERDKLIKSAVVGKNGLGLCPTCKVNGNTTIVRES